MSDFRFIDRASSPAALKSLTFGETKELCKEIRSFLIDSVLKTGGHLASSLGAVEITVGIHRLFDSPKDKVIFDVGHQAYVHKILTGRKDGFKNLRMLGGLSGFMKPEESEHDPVITGHASASVSSAIGLARAMKAKGEPGKVICVIGDGAMTGGMAYEALNDLGATDLPVIVVFNDNDMSITKSVGAIARRLSKIRLKPKYFKLKESIKRFLNRFSGGESIVKALSDFKKKLKRYIFKETLFEIMGLKYLGPADGNDLEQVLTLLSEAKRQSGPVVVHFKTVKGKGYEPAEKDPDKYHGISPESADTPKKSYSSAFGDILTELAEKDKNICAVTAAMENGTGLKKFHKAFPDRFFDVGIAEEHAVTMSAGMAAGGMTPVVCIYSTFLQRAYDQIIHDVAIAGLHVVFAVDRCGLVGEDGATHHGLLDVGYLCSVPGMQIYAPASLKELSTLMKKAVCDISSPVAVRFPRGGELGYTDDLAFQDSFVLQEGADLCLVCYGATVSTALKTAKLLESAGKSVKIIKLTRLDNADIREKMPVYFIEDCLSEVALGTKYGFASFNLGPDFIPCGSVCDLLKFAGLTPEKIAEEIING